MGEPSAPLHRFLDFDRHSPDSAGSSSFMAAFVNISAYKFTPLDDLPVLRDRVQARAAALGLKGTVLLSPEGINLFVAGSLGDVNAFIAALRAIPGLTDLEPKESRSAAQPFGRMRVK